MSRYVEADLQGAANTKRGYTADLSSFEDYCWHQELSYLWRAPPTLIISYADDMTYEGSRL